LLLKPFKLNRGDN